MGRVLGSEKEFAGRLLRWYQRHRRDLPWRTGPGRPGPLDPYQVWVSETMLQQTQVAAVVPYFNRFIARFPAIVDLADAEQQEVLRLWQGLGYYSRAHNLRAAARMVVSDFHGKVPENVEELLQLPGVGRYTAGAIASIAFGRRAPILDGNVTRVLCRIDNIAADPRDRSTQARLWQRAEQILPSRRVGDFNSALMELGATLCTPKNPQCLICPVREHCQACAAGTQMKRPRPKKTKPLPLVRRQTYCIRRSGRWLIERRPPRGRWAGMWQFLTVPGNGLPGSLPVAVCSPTHLGRFSHALTHRRYEFNVFIARAKSGSTLTPDYPCRWVTLGELDRYPLPRPHLRIAQMLRESADIG